MNKIQITKDKKSNRNINIELLRVIACLNVIFIHILDGGYQLPLKLKEYVRGASAIGVGVFWMITGYYLFCGNMPFIKRLKRTITKIIIPTLFTIVFANVFVEWINCRKSFMDCLLHPVIKDKKLLIKILTFDSSITLSGHLWYVFSYINIIIWFPLIKFICVDEKIANRVRRGYLILFAVSNIVNDLQMVLLPVFKMPYEEKVINIFTPLDINLFYVIMGFELYLFIKSDDRKYLKIYAIATSLITTFVSFACVELTRIQHTDKNYFYSIKSTFVIITAVSLFYFIMKIHIWEKLGSIIVLLGGRTFIVYLIHFMVTRKIQRLDFTKSIVGNNEIVLCIADMIIVTIIAFAIAIVFHLIDLYVVRHISALIKRLMHRNQEC